MLRILIDWRKSLQVLLFRSSFLTLLSYNSTGETGSLEEIASYIGLKFDVD